MNNGNDILQVGDLKKPVEMYVIYIDEMIEDAQLQLQFLKNLKVKMLG